LKKTIILVLVFIFLFPTFLFSQDKVENKEIKPKLIEAKMVKKIESKERKSPLLAYLERIERRLSENKKHPMTKSRRCKIIENIKEKLSKNKNRKKHYLNRINKIKKDVNEIDVFEKIGKDLIKRFNSIKTIDDGNCNKNKRK
jgi:hypothetical protein